ncbi:MAG: hypothetical protein MK085_06650 [Phycisphaerales bacterium]|nr:hypothetical protein [Phycisphaerales bacterium]
MEPTAPIPFRVAAAYATTPGTTARPAAPHPVGATIKAAVDRFEPTTDRSGVHGLVAGTVRSGINRGVDFDGDPLPHVAAKQAHDHAEKVLQFHAVSAARVEAATGVALGQTLDIQA